MLDVPEYNERFAVAFPQENDEWLHGQREHVIDSLTYGCAMASYERELVTRNPRYDRYVAGDDNALTTAELRGLELFFTKASAPNATLARCSATSSLL
ncbi:MAG: hypothetical protein IPP40_16105 [bacterium]|nr:hypothetical protein [bacterium]